MRQKYSFDYYLISFLVVEARLPMLEYDFSKQPDQGFDEITGEHGGYEMGVRGSSINFVFKSVFSIFKYF